MTSKKFAKQIDKYNKEIINFGAYLSAKDYILNKNAKEVGYLKDEKCYLIATPSLVKLFPTASLENPLELPVHQFIEIKDVDNKELFVSAVNAVYDDLYHSKDFVADISVFFESYKNYPEDIARLYDEQTIFLRFAYEHNLLKLNPLDLQGRIIKFEYLHCDLTEKVRKFSKSYIISFCNTAIEQLNLTMKKCFIDGIKN